MSKSNDFSARGRPAPATPPATSAVDAILKAVGDEFVPADLNRLELDRGLKWAETWYRTSQSLRKNKATLHYKLNQVAKTAQHLKLLLNDDEVWHKIGPAYPHTASYPAEILELLIAATKTLFSAAPPEPEWAHKAAKKFRKELGLDERSPFEWLAGQHLTKLFVKHFKCKATGRRTDGSPDTPYVRFAEATLAELGITHNGKPYARESIVKAMTSVSKGRKRRKN